MSDENLKFRVWDCNKGRYRRPHDGEGLFAISQDGFLGIWKDRESADFVDDKSRFIIERCTGLKDKDGAIIYEGDILEMKRHVFLEEFKVERYAVEYSPMLARWRLGKSCIYLNKDTAAECKIVGNVHENAEDLKK